MELYAVLLKNCLCLIGNSSSGIENVILGTLLILELDKMGGCEEKRNRYKSFK